MSTEHTVGTKIPPHETGWRCTVPLPPIFAPGEIPYPFIFEGPVITDEGSGRDKWWQCTTNVVKFDTTLPEEESEKQYRFYSTRGHNYGPFKDGYLIILGSTIELNEPGVYQFHHIISLIDTVKREEIRHVSVKSYKHCVVDAFENSEIVLRERTHHFDLIQFI